MKTSYNIKALLSLFSIIILGLGPASSQLPTLTSIEWNKEVIPGRARNALFPNLGAPGGYNTWHDGPTTDHQPMNVGIRVCLTINNSGGGGIDDVSDIVWGFTGDIPEVEIIKDYIINSKRDFLEGYVSECSTIPINTNTLLNQHQICFYYTTTGTSTITVDAKVNLDQQATAEFMFDVKRDPKSNTYYITGDGFNSPVNWTTLEGPDQNIPGLDKDNILGIHQLWDEKIQKLEMGVNGATVTTAPGESFRFHRYFIQAAACWKTIFGYNCIEPYISAQYDLPSCNFPDCNNPPLFPVVCCNNIPAGIGDTHAGASCGTPQCTGLTGNGTGSGHGIVQFPRTTSEYHRIEKLPRRFSMCGVSGSPNAYSCCCHINVPFTGTTTTTCPVETDCAGGAECTTSTDCFPAIHTSCDYDMVGNTPSPNEEKTLVDFANEDDLAANIVQYHNRMHDNVCNFGDFTNEWTTPADPFFFLYHSTLQRVYQLWQYLKLDDGSHPLEQGSGYEILNNTITVNTTDGVGAIVHYPNPSFTGFTNFEVGTCTNLPDEVFMPDGGVPASGTYFNIGTYTITGVLKDVVLLDGSHDLNTQGDGCMEPCTFQIEVLGIPPSDVYMEDAPYDNFLFTDNGNEPNTNTYSYWKSRDMWVRDSSPLTNSTSTTPNNHQPPEKGQTNYVHVELHNDRAGAEDIIGDVSLYWGNTSTGLLWPASFTLINTLNDVFVPQGQTIQVVIPWVPEVEGHHCLVAIWESGLDPLNTLLTSTTSINTLTRENNNIIWRNVNIVDNVPHHDINEIELIIRNTSNTATTVDLHLNGATYLAVGELAIDLGQTLFDNWQAAGGAGTNFILPGGTVVQADQADPMIIAGIPMVAGEEHKAIISFKGNPICLKGTRLGPFFVDLIQYENGVEVGGIAYQAAIGDRIDCFTPPDGMTSWWSGDHPGDGLEATDIQNRNNGVRVNEVGYGEGRVDRSFILDGLNDYIRVPDDESLDFGGDDPSGSGDFTIDAWIFLHGTPGRQVLVDKRSGTRGYSFFLEDARLGFGITESNGYKEFLSTTSAELGGWTHVAVTVDRDVAYTLFVDGVQKATFASSGLANIDSDADLIIGRESDGFGAGFLHAAIDEIEIFDRALDPGEIQSIYGAGSSGKCKDIRLEIEAILETDVSVNGGMDGAVDITMVGGAAPLTFEWSNTETTEDIAGLTAGTYTVTVTDAHTCTQVRTIEIIQPDVVCPTSPGTVHTNETLTVSTTFTGPHVVVDVLTVTTGTVLNINNGQIEFAGNGAIVVQEGARLNVNNSQLEACNVSWGGISVYGNSTLTQTPSNQGLVSLNNSELSDAKIGVLLGKIDPITQKFDASKSGGIARIRNGTKMKNNGISLYFTKYTQPSHQVQVTKSEFDQSSVAASYSTLARRQVVVNGSDGMEISDNTFTGGNVAIELNSTKKMQILKNEFSNLAIAIQGSNNLDLVIADNEFTDVKSGIVLEKGGTFEIKKNGFKRVERPIKLREHPPVTKGSVVAGNRFEKIEVAMKIKDGAHDKLKITCNEFIDYTQYAIKVENSTMADMGTKKKGAGNTFKPLSSLKYNCLDHNGAGFKYHFDPVDEVAFANPNIMSPNVTKEKANVNNGCKGVKTPSQAKSSNTDSSDDQPTQALDETIPDETIYEGYTLGNYPNPFSDGTIIAAYLPGEFPNAEIVVYNVMGSIIHKFELKPGRNFIEVSSNELNPGIYFYSLILDNNKIETKKMVHVK